MDWTIKVNPVRPTRRTIFQELFVNTLQLIPALYGLKCILTLHGKMLVVSRGAVYNYHHWVPVTGLVSMIIGVSYVCGGLFLYLSDGRPPEESYTWFRRFGRFISRWGSLLFMMVFWHQAHLLNENAGENFFDFLPSVATEADRTVLCLTSITFGIILLLILLIAIFVREQVKKALWANGCKPIHIWWLPLAYWVPWARYLGATGFRTVYSDASGIIHKGYCFVYRSFQQNRQWSNCAVKWLTDTVTGQLSLPEVWVDSEIIRPKLEKQDATNNLLENLDEPPESPK